MSNTKIIIIPNDVVIEILTDIVIPDDIVIEILSWVPAKSLLRLRWACKYWLDLITRDSDFINKHLLHLHHQTTITTTTTTNDDRIVNNTSFLLYDYLKKDVRIMNYWDVLNKSNGTVVNLDSYNLPLLPNDGSYNIFEFCGSCNGLVLVFCSSQHAYSGSRRHKYFLWNPCTREVKELPHDRCNTYPENYPYAYKVLGFGYDNTIDDYKVIRILSVESISLDNYNANAHHLTMEIGVYILGSNLWSTKIVVNPFVNADCWKGVGDHVSGLVALVGLLHNGTLHWMMRLKRRMRIIMCFDITKEEFRKMQGPDIFHDNISRNLDLSVFNGCLCICQETLHDQTIIWMMKDYGVNDSWTKLFTINMNNVVLKDSCFWSFHGMDMVTQYCKDGEILTVFGRTIVASDSKKNEARFMFSFENDLGDGYSVVASYIESLVSLDSGKYSTFAGSRTTTVQKQDLLEYDQVVDGWSVSTSQQRRKAFPKTVIICIMITCIFVLFVRVAYHFKWL